MLHQAQVREQTLELPPDAPLARVTAGFGTAGQKTWNLRRPVTLIGSRRPAHIVLHGEGISTAHCVVINTGTEILLKDLHTSGGTLCNDKPVDLIVLNDGDIINIGGTGIQVAIRSSQRSSDDSGCGMKYVDPTRFAEPIPLKLTYTEMHWTLESAVTLVGRHERAPVRLDHPEVSSRHALLFRFHSGPAVFSLSSRNGIRVNEQHCSLTPLADGDRISLGPFSLTLGGDSAAPTEASPLPGNGKVAAAPTAGTLSNPNGNGATLSTLTNSPPGASIRSDDTESGPLERALARSWTQLKASESRLREAAPTLEDRETTLAQRETEIDAREAELRGALHDIECARNQVAAREKEVAELAADAQSRSDETLREAKKQEKKRNELDTREEEVARREHIVEARWSCMSATICPHCNRLPGPANVSPPTQS